MKPNQSTARLAGLMYLILVITGILNLAYIPSRLIEMDDAAQTLQNIQQSETLFRWGIVSGIISYLAFLGLVWVLYQLLHPVNKRYAQVMVVLVLCSIPLSFVNLLHKFSVLSLLSDAPFVQGLSPEELAYQVMFYLQAYRNGINISQIFWGLWLFPFGYLVYRSGFLPKLLGILLMAGCFGYLIGFFGSFLVPGYGSTVFSTIVDLPSSLGEIGTCLWLLIMGTNTLSFGRSKKHATHDIVP
ncbi:MAG: DUF4386 domain-containing protein [Cyclobacteriaceae bacterium]